MSHVREVRFTMSHEAPLPQKPSKKKSMRKPRFPSQSPNFGKRATAMGNIVQQEEEEEEQEDDKFYRDANGPYTNARRTRILLYVALVWLVGLSTYLLFASAASDTHVPPPILAEKKVPAKWHIPFNLVPDNGGRIMTLKVPSMNFERLLRYDVCCRKGPYYVCRAVSKNVGIECYLTKDREAVVYIGHSDMVGAACTLMWTEQREKV